MIGERLAEFYAGIEEKWYDLLEFLDSKGLPVHVYNNILEEKGIPSLPFTLALLLVFIGLFYALFFVGTGFNAQLQLNFEDGNGNPLDGVLIEVIDTSTGTSLIKQMVNSGSTIKLDYQPSGKIFKIKASKENYLDSQTTAKILDEITTRLVVLKLDVKEIQGVVSFIDAETGTSVYDAEVKIEYDDATIQGNEGEFGEYYFPGALENVEGTLVVTADGYEVFREPIVLREGQLVEKELSPVIIGLVGETTLLINSLNAETGDVLNNVNITVFNATTNEVISSIEDVSGDYSTTVPTGTAIRVVVDKENFVQGISQDFTLRNEEEIITLYLVQGGKELEVNVFTITGVPLNETAVQVYTTDGVLVDSLITNLTGSVTFTGLNTNQAYYLTAYKNGYLHYRERIVPGEKENISIRLTDSTGINSAAFFVFVNDSKNKPANNASVQFFEVSGEELIPLGIPEMKTNESGFVQVRIQDGKKVLVKTIKGVEKGEKESKVLAGSDNEVKISLEIPYTLAVFDLVDEQGNPIKAKALVTSETGEILFDSNVSNGTIMFDAENYKFVQLDVELENGETYSEKINVSTEKEKQISIITKLVELVPMIEFVGIENEKGEEVDTITKGEYYFLKFETNWLKGAYKGGIHVRLGEDAVQFVDSQGYGILGYLADADDFKLGKSFTPKPEPGNEGIDLINLSDTGSYAKWIELYFNKLDSTKIVKIKIKARETAIENNFNIYYRAWAEYGNRIFRTPQDLILGEEKYTDSRSSLYAETKTQQITITEERPNCEGELCVDYSFISKDGFISKENEFYPFTGNVYALEMRLNSLKNFTPSIIVSTDNFEPKLGILNYQVQALGSFPTGDSDSVESRIENVNVKQGQERIIRIFFKTKKAENTFINVLIGADDIALEKTFYFNITEEKLMDITLVPTTINVGDDFVLQLKDAQTTEFINNASIKIENHKGELVRSLVGGSSINAGRNGEYRFTSGLEPGIYSAIISSKGYKTETKPVMIGRKDLFILPEEISLDIAKGSERKTENFFIDNQSKYLIKAISYEIDYPVDFPGEFEVELSLPEQLNYAQRERAIATADYSGTEEDVFYGEADVTIRGMVEGLFPVEAKTKLKIHYNRQLPEDCLVFDEDEINIDIMGGGAYNNTGATTRYSPSFYSGYQNYNTETGLERESAELTITNECGEPISFNAGVEENDKDPNLTLDVDDFVIQPNETIKIPLNVTNNIQRAYAIPVTRDYRIMFSSPKLSVYFPVNITIRNPFYSIQTNNNIVVYASLDEKYDRIVGIAPLNIQNIGTNNVQALRFSVDMMDNRNINVSVLPNEDGSYSDPKNPGYSLNPMTASYSGNMGFPGLPYSIGPGTGYSTPFNPMINPRNSFSPLGNPLFPQSNLFSGIILPGQQLVPPKTIFVSSTATKELNKGPYPVRINISGVINGKRYNLRTVNVFINVSGHECLKLIPIEALNFESYKSGGDITSRRIKLKNTCGETVRITSINSTTNLGKNKISLAGVKNQSLQPNEEKTFTVNFEKREDAVIDSTAKAYVNALLVAGQRTIKSNKINLTVRIGKETDTANKVFPAINVKQCKTKEDREEKFIQVKFPRIEQDDCTQGYCDSVSMSKFLTNKFKAKLKDVKRLIRTEGKGLVDNFPGCEKTAPFCSFDAMGVIKDSFDVYLQNDNISKEILEQNYKNELDNYTTVEKEINLAKISEEITSGFQVKQVYFNTAELTGCGRYRIQITGAVHNVDRKLLEDDTSLIVSIEKIGESTEQTYECQKQARNILNYLPIDKETTVPEKFGTWRAIITYDETQKIDGKSLSKEQKELMNEIASSFAKELFGSEERVSLIASQGTENILKLQIGSVEEGGLVKLEIEEISETGNSPGKVTATITDLILKAGKDEAKKIAKEAGKAIKSLTTRQVDGCISSTKDYFIINQFTEEKDNKFNVKIAKNEKGKSLLQVYTTEKCVDLNVESNFKEKVKLTTIWKKESKPTKEITGLTELGDNGERVVLKVPSKNNQIFNSWDSDKFDLSNAEYKEIKQYTEVEGNISGGETITLQKIKNKDKFVFPLKVCVQGTASEMKQVIGQVIEVKAISQTITADNLSGYREAKADLELSLCGIHPYDFMRKILQLRPENETTYYATLGWKGGEDSYTIEEMREVAVALINLEIAEGTHVEGTKIKKETDKAAQKIYKDKLKAVWFGYATFCGITSYTCNAVTQLNLLTPITDIIIDCALPAAWASKDTFEWSAKLGDVIGNLFSIINPFSKTPGEIANDITSPTNNKTTNENPLIMPAIFGVGADTARLAYKGSYTILTTKEIDNVAKELSAQFVSLKGSEMIKEAGITGAKKVEKATTFLTETVENAWKKSLTEQLKIAESQGKAIKLKEIGTYITKAKTETMNEVYKKLKTRAGFKDLDIVKNAERIISKSQGFTDEIIEEAATKNKSIELALELSDKTDRTSGYKIIGGGSYKDEATNLVKKLENAAIEKGQILELDRTYLYGPTPPLKHAADKTLVEELEELIKNKAESNAKKLLEHTPPVRGMPGEWYVKGNIEISEKEIANLLERSLEKVDVDKLIVKSSKKATTKLAREQAEKALDDLFTDATKLSNEKTVWQKMKSYVNSLKSIDGKLWKSIGWSAAKGFGCGILSEMAGIKSYNVAMKIINPANQSSASINSNDNKFTGEYCNGIDDDGDGEVDEDCVNEEFDSINLEKFETYAVTITKKPFDNDYEYQIRKVKSPEDFKEMSKRIKENPAIRLDTDCEKFLDREAIKYEGKLNPSMGKHGIGRDEVVIYHTYMKYIVQNTSSAEEEALMMAILSNSPQEINLPKINVTYGNPAVSLKSIDERWYTSNEQKIEATIKAVGELVKGTTTNGSTSAWNKITNIDLINNDIGKKWNADVLAEYNKWLSARID